MAHTTEVNVYTKAVLALGVAIGKNSMHGGDYAGRVAAGGSNNLFSCRPAQTGLLTAPASTGNPETRKPSCAGNHSCTSESASRCYSYIRESAPPDAAPVQENPPPDTPLAVVGV